MKDQDEELVLEIIVAESPKSKLKRSQPWNSVKEACLPLMDMVDWNRSMPYSIQETRHALGVETAYEMVNRVRVLNPTCGGLSWQLISCLGVTNLALW